jgi:hypothetical protein
MQMERGSEPKEDIWSDSLKWWGVVAAFEIRSFGDGGDRVILT